MPFCVFSPNKAVSGGALFAKLTRDNVVMLSAFKQNANNPDKRNNFDFKTGINVKLTEDEIGDILRAIRSDGKMKFYHTFDDKVTSGNFSFYNIEAKGESPSRSGFGFSVTKNEVTVKVGFSVGAAERFSEFLKLCLSNSFNQILAEDDAKDKEYAEAAKTKTENKASPKKAAKEPTPEPEPEPNDALDF